MSRQSNEGYITLAHQAPQPDPKLSLQKAASIYNVSFSTLRRRYAGRPAKRDTRPRYAIVSAATRWCSRNGRSTPSDARRATRWNQLGCKLRTTTTRAPNPLLFVSRDESKRLSLFYSIRLIETGQCRMCNAILVSITSTSFLLMAWPLVFASVSPQFQQTLHLINPCKRNAIDV